MKHILKQSLPVMTSDNYRLGQVHTLYHRLAEPQPELALFASYVMVVNIAIGDDFYVPTSYIDETRDAETAVYLTITRDDVTDKQITRIPEFIVEGQFEEEKLPECSTSAATIPEIGKPFEDEIMPLPPNLQANPTAEKVNK